MTDPDWQSDIAPTIRECLRYIREASSADCTMNEKAVSVAADVVVKLSDVENAQKVLAVKIKQAESDV